MIAFMAPRSGKTTALGVPYVLSAPGPGRRDQHQSRPVGRHRRAARAARRPGVAVRPAAHHRPAAGMVVEPAAPGWPRSKPRTGWPPTSC